MTDQFVDMLEGVQRPQIARLQAEVGALRDAVRVLRWELHQQHRLEARHWVTERDIRMEDCSRCKKLSGFDAL